MYHLRFVLGRPTQIYYCNSTCTVNGIQIYFVAMKNNNKLQTILTEKILSEIYYSCFENTKPQWCFDYFISVKLFE